MPVQTLVPNTSQLALDDIQGDILIGLQKRSEAFIFFTIRDTAAFKQCAHRAVTLGLITSTAEVIRREQQLAVLKKAGNKTRLPLFGANIGFSHRGLGKLLGDPGFATGLPGLDPAFVRGPLGSAAALGDDPDSWQALFREGDFDGILIFTGPDETQVEAQSAALLHIFNSGINNTVDIQFGNVRAAEPGHEHFGFEDGISQPGIRNLTKQENPADPAQGLPGQDLIWAGEFVFGYPGQKRPVPATATSPAQMASKDDQGPIATPPAPWMKNGSYMVWRRLNQEVLAFREVTQQKAEQQGMQASLLQARLVGRWPSGAPLVKAPLQDNAALGGDAHQNNDFEYAGDDPAQRACPYAAHIRKTYPRDDLNDAAIVGVNTDHLKGTSGEAEVQTRRIRRAGIPFGPEVDEEKEKVGQEEPRGLMFVCYQTSITEQFEFIQKSWANDPNFVHGKKRPGAGGAPITPGHDLIIGQVNNKAMDEPVPNYPTGNTRSTLTGMPQFVKATAAGYFFMPSLSALASGLR